MPDAKFDALVRRDPSVALDHRPFGLQWAQFTAKSTTLRTSAMLPSPVRLPPRPWWTARVGSIRSLSGAPAAGPESDLPRRLR